jgi:carnitine 3-dehydrogenase
MAETSGNTIARAACIGGGVIGGGWVARFALNGIDVAVHDPHPDAGRIIGEIVDNAARAYAGLTMAPLPPRGAIRFCATLEEAVAGADWIQESVPERLDLKRSVLEVIDAAAPEAALIGSSTSGLKPSDLQAGMKNPGRFFVAHPYNPVYLLPVVELVGGEATAEPVLDDAAVRLSAIGMKGVVIAKEIEAFVGDRLLESVWREALWLIRDGICDTETLDDIIRYGFGMRWAQMGLFETYRIAGGEAGMRHFLAQFGPALSWPWTHLMDVPDLNDALVERIATQSDAQARGRSVRELERIRDDNLVAIMQALKGARDGEGWGAGELLKDYEARLWADAPAADQAALDIAKPLALHAATVGPAWIDYNGHMTEHRYLQVFGDATDALLRLIGAGLDYVRGGSSYYTVETHIRHLGEARPGERLEVATQVIASDEKRIHLFHTMRRDEAVLATAEQMLLHVDVASGRAVPAARAVLDRLGPITDAHAALARPEGAGRHIGVAKS